MLSIDITDRQIKFVRGAHSGNKIRIQDADMRELSMGMISNGYVTDVPMVASELNDIIKSKDIKEKEAIVSITSSSIVYKEMTVAKPKNMKNPAIIEAMIQSEMNITSDYNISFTIAGETEDAEKNKMLKVIAAACPQRLVDGYVRLFSHIGLQLKGVSIANNSVTRLILNTPKLADRMPMLLVQVDKNFLNMNLYEDGQLAFSRFSNIDPNDYENASDYVSRAVYENLFRMIQFIQQRGSSSGIKEILFYGEIDRFMEISNALGSFNIPVNMLSMPASISSTVQFDFTKFANAIGALYRRDKELEHINLLEATSAKESKGSNGFLLALLGVMVASAAVVGGAYFAAHFWNESLNSQIKSVQADLNNPALQNDLKIVTDRENMLAGFKNYNDTVNTVKLLFNYKPKVQSLVVDKLREPLPKLKEDNEYGVRYSDLTLFLLNDELDFTDSILTEDQRMDITALTIGEESVTVGFRGLCKGNPADIPAKYAEALTEKVLDKYGQPYFVNVTYTGFTKDNISDDGSFALLAAIAAYHESTDPNKKITDADLYDTYFSFEMTMQLKPGSDELHTDIDDDFGLNKQEEGKTEVAQ
ncbi:MAG: pilus assembly protein PilM [Oscillospiraceae bacterium]|nr:pilus assembly protein PilM [Oscillospiraceae bacterium]